MDGTYKTSYRKVFILTTNKRYINDNLLNRPGRLRYTKEFGDLTPAQVEEVVDDCLINKQFKDDVIDFIKPLKIITVDIVKAVVSEVNIHNEDPKICCKDLNVEEKEVEYDVIDITRGEGEKEAKPIETYVNHRYFYGILEQKTSPIGRYFHADGLNWYIRERLDPAQHIYMVSNDNTNKNMKKVRIQKRKVYHSMYAF